MLFLATGLDGSGGSNCNAFIGGIAAIGFIATVIFICWFARNFCKKTSKDSSESRYVITQKYALLLFIALYA